MAFLKYPGKKTAHVAVILKMAFNSGSQHYVEPFCGSAVVAENMLLPNRWINDANPHLIAALSTAINRWGDLIERCRAVWDRYEEREDGYNLVRYLFNNMDGDDLHKSALYIYLNKHCFNGLPRYNKAGKFNAPQGRKVVPIPVDQIRETARLLADVRITCLPFEVVFENLPPRAFVYCDPPYLGTFGKYTPVPFMNEDHRRLNEVAIKYSKRGGRILVAGEDTPTFYDYYSGAHTYITMPDSRSSISGNPTGRGLKREILALYRG